MNYSRATKDDEITKLRSQVEHWKRKARTSEINLSRLEKKYDKLKIRCKDLEGKQRETFPPRSAFSAASSSSNTQAAKPPSHRTPSAFPPPMSDDEASSIALVWQLQMEQEQQQAARQARFYPFRASNFEPELPRMRRPVGLERFNGQMDIDPDNLSYEELLQLGETIGDVAKERWSSRAKDVIAKLPQYVCLEDSQDAEPCIICQGTLSLGDGLRVLPCEHEFHQDCVDPWLLENNSCPLCKAKVCNKN